MQIRLSDAAAAAGGRVRGPDVTFDGASNDSRSVRRGQLFVPVVAARDGHDYVDAALAAGAAAYLTAREPRGGSAICVDDTVAALQRLGSMARGLLPEPVVAITGSVGKTSAKDLTAAALGGARRTHASERSFNNELGVSLTLLGAPADTEVTILEMGARGPGHIRQLCEVARPTVGVVTVVAAAHTSEFDSLDAIAAAKRELVEALPASGTAVLNADDPRVSAMAASTAAGVVTFGSAGADIVATGVELDGELRPRFEVTTPGGSASLRLAVAGAHHVTNALAALAVAGVVGVPLDAAVAGLESAELSPWRMALHRTPGGGVVINDAYNANPTSVEAALRALAALDAERRVAVLGVMAELGDGHDAAHQAVGELASALGLEVISVGEPAYGGTDVADIDAALARLGPVGPGMAVLVKGSRVAGLERLAARLGAG